MKAPKILIVEDSIVCMALIKNRIKNCLGDGVIIIEAGSVAEAKQAFIDNCEAPFNAVILDLILPDSYGIDTIYKIKATDKDIPIIVFTGFKGDFGIDKEVLQVQDFIGKDEKDWWIKILKAFRSI